MSRKNLIPAKISRRLPVMRPTITAIQGSTPAGPTDTPAADPRFGGQQSLHVVGSGFTGALGIFLNGPAGPEGCKMYNSTDTECDIVAHLPVRGIYAALVATPETTSEWFNFTVI